MKLAFVAATAFLVAASPATARDTDHSVTLHDGPGDVWTFSNVTTGYTPAAQPGADVLEARVAHGRDAVRVSLVFDDLKRVDTQWYWCNIRTPDGKTSWFVLEAAEGHWRGIAYQEIEGEWVRVRGLSHHIDYAADVVTLGISRTLLGRPGWVRVKLWNELGLGDGSTFFTDNPTTATAHPAFTERLQQS